MLDWCAWWASASLCVFSRRLLLGKSISPGKAASTGVSCKLGWWHCSRRELYSDATELMSCEALVVKKQNIWFLCRMENSGKLCIHWLVSERDRLRYLHWASHFASLSCSLSYCPCPCTLSYLLSFSEQTKFCFCTMLKNSLCCIPCASWFCSWTSCLLTLGWLQRKVCLLLKTQFLEEGLKVLLFQKL